MKFFWSEFFLLLCGFFRVLMIVIVISLYFGKFSDKYNIRVFVLWYFWFLFFFYFFIIVFFFLC